MLGNIFLTVALLGTLFSIVMYYYAFKGYENSVKYARIGYHVLTIAVIGASLFLLHAILTHQYQFKYVYGYSDNSLPLGLLISSFFAGQAGSILLWILFSVIVGLFLMDFTSKRENLEAPVMIVFLLTVLFLLILINPLLNNPFSYIWESGRFVPIKNINPVYLSLPFVQRFIFEDQNNATLFVKISGELVALLKQNNIPVNQFIINGNGMNPLLQNFWMQIHPPFLFVGFAMSAVPYSFAIAALINNDYRNWVKYSLPWLSAVALVLGAAIMLGGYWSYGVLGWGGWWGWDPVENSSLVPWIIAVAAIHTMLVQKHSQKNSDKPGRFIKINLLLSVLTFVLVIYSTFLTRSGVLSDASVHSFVAPGRVVFLILLIFMFFFTILGVGAFLYRFKYLEENYTFEENFWSRELALFTGTIILIAASVIIIFGTSLPIIGQTVDIAFYNKIALPVAVLLALVNGLSLKLRWGSTNPETLWKEIRLPLAISFAAVLAIMFLANVYRTMYLILIFFNVFALIINSEIAIKIIKKRPSYLGAYLTHIGIAIFVFGVLSNGGYTKEKHVKLPKNVPVKVFGYNLTFTGYEPFDNGKKFRFNVIAEKGNEKIKLSPVMYIVEMDNSLMREPDIIQTFPMDFYVSPVSFDDAKTEENSLELSKGETKIYDGLEITFEDFEYSKDFMNAMRSGDKMTVGARLKIKYDGKEIVISPKQIVEKKNIRHLPARIYDKNIDVDLAKLDASGKIKLIFSGGEEQTKVSEIFSADVSFKPLVSLIWIGVIVMSIGFIFSIVYRMRESK